MTRRPLDEDDVTARLDELSGQVAALVAYVAHIPGAETVSPRDLRGTLGSLAPARSSRSAPESPFDVAMRTAEKIAELARHLAALRSAGR